MTATWSSVALGDIFEIARGGSPRPIERYITDSPDGLNWVKIGDATEGGGKYISRTREKIRPEGVSKTRRVRKGDFLLTNSMSFGRPYIMATDGCIHDGWLLLRPRDEELVDRSYFYHLLSSDLMFAQFSARAAGSTVKNLNTDIVSSVQVKLPPVDEQRRIAAILDKADALRQKRKRAIALLDSLPQAIFLEMFGDPIQNPNGFRTVPLDQIVSPKRPITYGILMPGADLSDGVPYVRVVDIQRGKVLVDQLRRTSTKIDSEYKRSRLRQGDLLISIRGHVGRMAIVPQDAEGANITQDTARLAIDGADARYVMATLTTDTAQHWMFQRTKGAAVRGINLGDLRKFPVPLPPQAEQERFAATAKAIEELLSGKNAAVALSEQAFSSLQHRAFSGQL